MSNLHARSHKFETLLTPASDVYIGLALRVRIDYPLNSSCSRGVYVLISDNTEMPITRAVHDAQI